MQESAGMQSDWDIITMVVEYKTHRPIFGFPFFFIFSFSLSSSLQFKVDRVSNRFNSFYYHLITLAWLGWNGWAWEKLVSESKLAHSYSSNCVFRWKVTQLHGERKKNQHTTEWNRNIEKFIGRFAFTNCCTMCTVHVYISWAFYY